ncbi:MAG: hypothetical protein ACL7AX_12935 [Candidatus Arsenophonus phytopathogenicus]
MQPGWGCSPNGLVGRTPEGALLSCQNGRWASGASLQQRECKQMGNWRAILQRISVLYELVCCWA